MSERFIELTYDLDVGLRVLQRAKDLVASMNGSLRRRNAPVGGRLEDKAPAASPSA